MSQLRLVEPSADDTVGEARDALDRHYTPDALARCCVAALDGERVWPDRIIEPSVGGGAFVRAARERWPDVEIEAWDLDAAAPGLALANVAHVGDWPAARPERADLVLGNPPFSGVDAIPHVERAIAVGDAVALILPWAPLGGVAAWYHLLHGARPPAIVWPICPRPWSEHVRETALYLWRGGPRQRTQIGPPLVWR